MVCSKHRLTLFILFLQLTLSYSQNKFGLMTGVAYNMQLKSATNFHEFSYWYHNTTFPSFGFFYRDKINDHLSLRTGAYFVRRGFKFNYNFSSPWYGLDSKQKIICNYVSFPINLNFNYKKVYIGIGTELSFLINANYFFDVSQDVPGGSSTHDKITYTNKDGNMFNIIDGGYSLNIGYRMKNIEMELNLYRGLLTPRKFDSYFTIQHFEYKYNLQQTLSLNFIFYPNFKKKELTK